MNNRDNLNWIESNIEQHTRRAQKEDRDRIEAQPQRDETLGGIEIIDSNPEYPDPPASGAASHRPAVVGGTAAWPCPKCGYISRLDLSAPSLQQPVIAASGTAVATSEPQEQWTVKQWKDGVGQPRNSWDIWAGKQVIVSDLGQDECYAIAAAHNAAIRLAELSERQHWSDALAAERASLEDLRTRYDSIRDKLWKTEDELKAERERRKPLATANLRLVEALEQLSRLCDVIEIRYPNIFRKDVKRICDSALAQAKEQP